MCNYIQTHSWLGAPVTPTFVDFDEVAKTFTVETISDVGIYTVTLTATIPQPSLGTGGILQTSTTFTLTVVHECSITSLNDRTIANMFVKVTETAT